MKQINDDDLKNLSLNAILIKPVQRITKYSLFIDQLIKVRPIVRFPAKCLKKIEILPEHGRDPLWLCGLDRGVARLQTSPDFHQRMQTPQGPDI
jgi:hypothetical protein